jgi:hypothetical protein
MTNRTPKRKSNRGGCLYNLITLLFLLGSVALIVYFALIWVDPYSALNPLSPPTPLPLVVTATPAAGQDTPDAAASGSGSYRVAAQAYVPHSGPEGCAFAAIAGSVEPEVDTAFTLAVRADGLSDEITTGSAPDYGPNGFVYRLGDSPLEGAYVIQLFDADGAAISPAVPVETVADCERAVVIIRFVEEAGS